MRKRQNATNNISNPLSSFCLESSTVQNYMALYRKGSLDIRFGESAFLCPYVIFPHFARNERNGDLVERLLRFPSFSFSITTSGVDSTEGTLLSPSSNSAGPMIAQRKTENYSLSIERCNDFSSFIAMYSYSFFPLPLSHLICQPPTLS